MANNEPYDAVIVGSGAGGGMAAWVLCLERIAGADARSRAQLRSLTKKHRCSASPATRHYVAPVRRTKSSGITTRRSTVAGKCRANLMRVLRVRTLCGGVVACLEGARTTGLEIPFAWVRTTSSRERETVLALTGQSSTRTWRPGTTRPRQSWAFTAGMTDSRTTRTRHQVSCINRRRHVLASS